MHALIAGAALFTVAPPSSQGLIAVGVNWGHGVFVQEYWRLGFPYYNVTNTTAKDISVSVVGKAKLAGPVKIKKDATKPIRIEVAAEAGKLVRVDADGRSLGVIDHCHELTPPPDDGFATCMGLNGSGGRDLNIWMVQKSMKFPAASTVEVTFVVKSRPGQLFLLKQLETVPSDSVAFVPIKSAKSETLPLREDDKGFYIDLGNPKKEAAWHRITARFETPATKTPRVAMVEGLFTSGSGGGHGLSRGFVVVPKGEE